MYGKNHGQIARGLPGMVACCMRCACVRLLSRKCMRVEWPACMNACSRTCLLARVHARVPTWRAHACVSVLKHACVCVCTPAYACANVIVHTNVRVWAMVSSWL